MVKLKRLLQAGGAAAVISLLGGFCAVQAAVPEESRRLEALHKAALAEGGRVIEYAGGDTAGQQDGMKSAFESRFPCMTLDVIVDFSKFHEARIDNQIATKSLVSDVVQIQTLQNFPCWKSEGRLLPYKPIGWSKVYPAFKDKDGAYTGVFVDAFSNVINSKLLPDSKQWPREAKDYLRPEFKGRIVMT
ncbi:hypothetical protein QF017_001083 [Pseudomonas laurylsulfatiphila]|uniref:hypothetical protein n=1 Tax=Pseudomonas laurylsulfatiphila TaxID=2011015 RepID=UPI003D1AC7F4